MYEKVVAIAVAAAAFAPRRPSQADSRLLYHAALHRASAIIKSAE